MSSAHLFFVILFRRIDNEFLISNFHLLSKKTKQNIVKS